MNEQIQELFNKASVYAYEQNPGENSYGRPVDENKYEEDRYTKFAELIVQECIDKIETYRIPVGNSAAGEMACEWTYEALTEVRDEIKKHFGVEE